MLWFCLYQFQTSQVQHLLVDFLSIIIYLLFHQTLLSPLSHHYFLFFTHTLQDSLLYMHFILSGAAVWSCSDKTLYGKPCTFWLLHDMTIHTYFPGKTVVLKTVWLHIPARIWIWHASTTVQEIVSYLFSLAYFQCWWKTSNEKCSCDVSKMHIVHILLKNHYIWTYTDAFCFFKLATQNAKCFWLSCFLLKNAAVFFLVPKSNWTSLERT